MWTDGRPFGSTTGIMDAEMEDQMNGKKLTVGERAGSTLSINYPLAYPQMNQFGTPSMHSLCSSSVAPSTIIEQQAQRLHENFIIDDYMQKIDTKVELLENELKFAWRALDLLTQEYSKMAQKLDKIDKLAGDQQLVVQNLINLTLHNDAKAYEDMLANSDRYEAFRRKVLQETAAASGTGIGAPFQINDLEFDNEEMALGKLNMEGLQTMPDMMMMEDGNNTLYEDELMMQQQQQENGTRGKSDIPIYYSSNPFRDASMFARHEDMEMSLNASDVPHCGEQQELLASLRHQQQQLQLKAKQLRMEGEEQEQADLRESDNFEHFKKRLETMKQDVYANNDASASKSLVAPEASTSSNMQSYLKDLLMAQRVGEGLEEGIDPIAEFGQDSKSQDQMNAGSSDGLQRGQRSSKRNRSQHKKLIATEMELLNNQMLQRRQQKSTKKDEEQKDDDQKRAVLVDVVTRLINERYQHIRTTNTAVDKSLVTNQTLTILHNETYLLMRIFFFFYMRSSSVVGERERSTMLWKFIGHVLGGPEISETDDPGIALLNEHIQSTIQMLKTLSAEDFQDHLQTKLDESKRLPLGSAHVIDFDIESFFCKGSSPKISISTSEDFELQIEKEDEPKPSTSSSCYQFELIKRRYDMEEQKRSDNPKPLKTGGVAGGSQRVLATSKPTTTVLNNTNTTSQDQNDNIYDNDQYIQSLKRNLERHNSMLYLLHLQGQEKDKSGLEDDKNKLMLDMMMDKLLQDEQSGEAVPGEDVADISAAAASLADGEELEEMNSSNSPPPPAPIAPFLLCREQDEDSEDGIEYEEEEEEDYNGNDVFARMMTEGNMNVDDYMSRAGHRELLQFESWNDFAPECDQNNGYGYTSNYSLGNGVTPPPTGKVVHSKPKSSRGSSGGGGNSSGYNKQPKAPPSARPSNHQLQYAGYDTTEVDSNIKYLEQMGRSQPICSPFENHSRFAAAPTYPQQMSTSQQSMASQLSGPPDLLKLYLEQQQHSAAVGRSRTPEPPLSRHVENMRPRSQSIHSPSAGGGAAGLSSGPPPIPQRMPIGQSAPPGVHPRHQQQPPIERGASKKRKFQMVAKLQHWLHEQSSSSGNESRSADGGHGGHSGSSGGGGAGSWMKKKHFRFRSQSLSEPMNRGDEVSDQESLEGSAGYMVGGRRRSFMKTVKKEIGKRVRKVIVKGSVTSPPPYSSHPDLAAPSYSGRYPLDPMDRSSFCSPEEPQVRAPSVNPFETISRRGAPPVSVQVSEPLDSTESDDMNDLFRKVGEHPKPQAMSPPPLMVAHLPKPEADRSSHQYLTQGNNKSASISSSNSATSSGGESGGLGAANAQSNSGPNAFIFNNSTSMEFAASRKVGKYRKGKRESSSEGHSDTAESGNNMSSGNNNNNNNNTSDAHEYSMKSDTGENPALDYEEYTIADQRRDSAVMQQMKQIPSATTSSSVSSTAHMHKNAMHFPHIQKVNSICIDEINDSPPPLPSRGLGSNGFVVDDSFSSHGLAESEEESMQQCVKPPMTTNSSPSVHGGNSALLSTNWCSVSVDEDSRSQHSYRTIASGGTSRRQSTEDSIDTDDEYFCYELRKLEEMEREAHDISFLKESGRLPQFEFEDSSYPEPAALDAKPPEESFAHELHGVATAAVGEDMVDEAVKELFRSVVHPELRVSSQMSLTRKLNVLKTVEETRTLPAKRRDGSGLNFLLRGDEEERKLYIKFYTKELRYLTNPTLEEDDEGVEEEEAAREDILSEDEIQSPQDMRSRSGSQSSGGSSSTTSGPESNPDVFSDYEEELEGQDKLRDEYHQHHRHEADDEQITPDENFAKSSMDESVLIGDAAGCSGDGAKAVATSGAPGAGGVGGGAPGAGGSASKWKLLKTLKDRKAEEKTNQEKIKEEEDTKDKVSVVRKFLRLLSMSYVALL